MSVSPYERNELFRGQPLRPSQVRETVRRLSPGTSYGGQYGEQYGGGQWGGDQFYGTSSNLGGGQYYGGGGGQFDQWNSNLNYDQRFLQRPISGGYGGGGGGGYDQRFLQRPISGGYGGGSQWYGGGEQFRGGQRFGGFSGREQFTQRQPLYGGSSFYQAPLQPQFINRSYLPEVTHVHQPEIIREVVEEDRPLIREVVHVQHRPITVKDVFLKEPAPALPPLEKRRVAPPELMREVVHEVKPVIREVVHHERRPVIVREKYAVERQPQIRHFSETLMHKHIPGENIMVEPLSSSGYETVGELYGQPMSSSMMNQSLSQPVSGQ